MRTIRTDGFQGTVAEFAGKSVSLLFCGCAWIVVLAAGACSHGGGNGERIAVFTKNQTDPYFEMLRMGTEDAARQMQARVTQYMPTQPSSIPEQMSQIEDVVTRRPDAVVFVPVDFKAMTSGVERLNQAHIPVVDVTERMESADIVTFVGVDDYHVGLETARYLFKAMNGKGGIIILEGVRGVRTSSERQRGFMKALQEFPGITLLASQTANYQRLMALQVAENLIQAHPDIAGVLAASDGMALGALEAFAGANKAVLAVGIDGTKEAIDAIKAGRLLASGDNNGFMQGCIGMMAAIRTVRKMPVPKDLIFPAVVIGKSNYQAWDIPDAQRKCPAWETLVKS
jgi:ribose transport system substrate-binding protein